MSAFSRRPGRQTQDIREEATSMSTHRFAILLLGALLAAGCSSGDTRPDDAAGQADGQDGAATQRAPGEDGFDEGSALGTADGMDGGEMAGDLMDRNLIYFDFDSSSVRAEYSELLAAHATYLRDHPNASVRLEGHTDERGSREYNIGLGERRGQAVRRALMLQGVGATQISTVSYGEERPAVTGSDEEAWGMNRRVEIVYLR
jgi:peptidoglycan-associated lipoprotein